MTSDTPKQDTTYHRFLDEMGDTTFWGKGRQLILGQEGVSHSFGLGIVKFNRPIKEICEEVQALQTEIEADPLFNTLPSVQKRIKQGGFFFHACKDTPDVRAVFMRYIRQLDCQVEAVVARKIPALFEKNHHDREDEFYADLLSHLIKHRLKRPGKLVLNIAARGSATRDKSLNHALELALQRAEKRWQNETMHAKVVFNVQTPLTEPLLNIADYLCWTIQRVFERGETRYYDYLQERIRLVVDLYDFDNYAGSKNYYNHKRPLTPQNKLSPPNT